MNNAPLHSSSLIVHCSLFCWLKYIYLRNTQTISELDCNKRIYLAFFRHVETFHHLNNPKKHTEMTQRNITRYTYETTSFQGWRLSICRKWNQFTKYFSDRQYGSEEAAFQAAIEMRDRIFSALQQSPDDPRAVFERFKNGLDETPAVAPATVPATK